MKLSVFNSNHLTRYRVSLFFDIFSKPLKNNQ